MKVKRNIKTGKLTLVFNSGNHVKLDYDESMEFQGWFYKKEKEIRDWMTFRGKRAKVEEDTKL